MALVFIPPLLRNLTRGQETVEVPGHTVRQVIEELEKQFPGVYEHLVDGKELRPGLAVAVDSQISRLGFRQPVEDRSEIHFLPAISGG